MRITGRCTNGISRVPGGEAQGPGGKGIQIRSQRGIRSVRAIDPHVGEAHVVIVEEDDVWFCRIEIPRGELGQGADKGNTEKNGEGLHEL